MINFPGIPACAPSLRFYVREAWLKNHPGEEPPESEIEIAIVIMALETRSSDIMIPGQDKPSAQQKGWPIVELARIPYYAWRRKMDELFGVTKEADNGESGNPAAGTDTAGRDDSIILS